MINDIIIQNARKWLGQREIQGNLGFYDETFSEWMVKHGWRKGWAWCAVFAKGAWVDSYEQVYGSDAAKEIKRLFSPNVQRTAQLFASDERFPLSKEPSPGALMVFQMYKNGKPQLTGHIAIVERSKLPSGKVMTIEGNTNAAGSREGDRVAQKIRLQEFDKKDGLRLRGYIRPIEFTFDNKAQ